MSFAIHFGQIVVPKLRHLIRCQAACIVAGVDTFAGAHLLVMDQARELGATYLPRKVYDDLDDWVSETLLLETEALECWRANPDQIEVKITQRPPTLADFKTESMYGAP